MKGGSIRGRMVEKPIILCGKEGTLWIRTPSQQLSSSMKTSPHLSVTAHMLKLWFRDSIFTEFRHQRAIDICYASDSGQRFLCQEKDRFALKKAWLEVKPDDWNSVRLHWFLSTYFWMIRDKTYRGSHIFGILFILNGRMKSSFACKWPE
jgi:hypothetical protein